jgi:signal transduction histidine kinase
MRELSLHILDALENSREAGATAIELVVEEDTTADRLAITIRDNGRGMSQAQLDRIGDPFFTTRTTRHVGLGIPLFKAAAERCNGNLTVTSQPGRGTTLQATLTVLLWVTSQRRWWRSFCPGRSTCAMSIAWMGRRLASIRPICEPN